ncbi:hypothetical protein [Inquilinus limosus]|uniref:hypothetical protein n=1 Tax=Inquilinus limosus TaxID=171674 RepID=UPI0011982725|nr:hypothetical protein [Inquilinus limosus]
MLNPLALPHAIRWDNFARAWKDARFSQTFVNSALLTGVTILLDCTTGSASAYVLARREIRRWKLVTFYCSGRSPRRSSCSCSCPGRSSPG